MILSVAPTCSEGGVSDGEKLRAQASNAIFSFLASGYLVPFGASDGGSRCLAAAIVAVFEVQRRRHLLVPLRALEKPSQVEGDKLFPYGRLGEASRKDQFQILGLHIVRNGHIKHLRHMPHRLLWLQVGAILKLILFNPYWALL